MLNTRRRLHARALTYAHFSTIFVLFRSGDTSFIFPGSLYSHTDPTVYPTASSPSYFLGQLSFWLNLGWMSNACYTPNPGRNAREEQCIAKTLYRKFETKNTRNKTARLRSQFLHSWICERFIYSQDQSACVATANWVDRSLGNVNRS